MNNLQIFDVEHGYPHLLDIAFVPILSFRFNHAKWSMLPIIVSKRYPLSHNHQRVLVLLDRRVFLLNHETIFFRIIFEILRYRSFISDKNIELYCELILIAIVLSHGLIELELDC